MNRRRGYTFVEFLITAAILVILAAIVYSVCDRQRKRADYDCETFARMDAAVTPVELSEAVRGRRLYGPIRFLDQGAMQLPLDGLPDRRYVYTPEALGMSSIFRVSEDPDDNTFLGVEQEPTWAPITRQQLVALLKQSPDLEEINATFEHPDGGMVKIVGYPGGLEMARLTLPKKAEPAQAVQPASK